MRESGPCADCISIIKELGIKRVVYSSGHHKISACHPDDYTTEHHTLGRRFLNSDNDSDNESNSDSDRENSSGYKKTANTCKSHREYSKPINRQK